MLTPEFLLTSLIVVLIPGTGVLFTISTGLLLGRRASFYAAIGCTAGIVPHLLATILGLAALLHTSALAFQLLKYLGAAYLFYLAWATWRNKAALALGAAPDTQAPLQLMLRALLLNILNPKLTLFFLAFLPQFVLPGHGAPLAQMLILSGVFMAMTLAVFCLYGLLAHAFRQAVLESARVQNGLRRTFAAAFAGLGANLALTEH